MDIILSHKSIPKKKRLSIENQDCYLIHQISNQDSKHIHLDLLVALSDGMGGLDEPLLASNLSVQTAFKFLVNHDRYTNQYLGLSIVEANKTLLSVSGNKSRGATLTIFYIREEYLYFGHIGDCRLLLIRDNEVKILTEDHSKAARNSGMRNPTNFIIKDAKFSKNLIKCLGQKEFDINYVQTPEEPIQLKTNDIIILCSDGTWSEIEPTDMINIIENDPYTAANQILHKIEEGGCKDDATCIVIKVA